MQTPEQRRDWYQRYEKKRRLERYHEDPALRASNRRRALKSRGWTPGQVDEALALQEGRCWICRLPFESKGERKLNADHDHQTGKRRGLLCSRCNKLEGQLLRLTSLGVPALGWVARLQLYLDTFR